MTIARRNNTGLPKRSRKSRVVAMTTQEEEDKIEVVSTVSVEETEEREYISRPRDLDVCCGRGKGFFSHPGNRIFQKMVRDNMDNYQDAESKNCKSAIVAEIVHTLLSERDIRFVKKDRDVGKWYVLSHSVAHEKTGHAIRDQLMQRKKQERKIAAGQEASRKASHKMSSIKKNSRKTKHQVRHRRKATKAQEPVEVVEIRDDTEEESEEPEVQIVGSSSDYQEIGLDEPSDFFDLFAFGTSEDMTQEFNPVSSHNERRLSRNVSLSQEETEELPGMELEGDFQRDSESDIPRLVSPDSVRATYRSPFCDSRIYGFERGFPSLPTMHNYSMVHPQLTTPAFHCDPVNHFPSQLLHQNHLASSPILPEDWRM